MKVCPSCNRNYGDDTLIFCLDDGASLSASYDPHGTLKGPVARATDPPKTEILPSQLAPGNQRPPPFRSSNPAFVSPTYPQEAPQSQLTEKRSTIYWIVLSGTLALMVAGLVIVLGYLAWKANSKSTPETSSASSTAPKSSDSPANAISDDQSKLPDDSNSQWLDGMWKGEGYQSDTKTTWAVRLTVQDGTYAIEYPNIPCQGMWKLIDKNSREASFTELITEGTDRCDTNNHVLIQKISDSEISCKYTRASSRVVIATATLSKKAQSNDQR